MKNLLLLFLFLSCSSPEPNHSHYQEIRGRNLERIYRIKSPSNWVRRSPTEPPTDTTLPICEYFIENSIRITIHNFPSQEITDRIPPGLQIARWKKQISPTLDYTIPQSFSGYVGFLFEAENETTAVMGWILQLGAEQYSRLGLPELRSDVTIKAQGPKELIQKYRLEIIKFARSFELIYEIP